MSEKIEPAEVVLEYQGKTHRLTGDVEACQAVQGLVMDRNARIDAGAFTWEDVDLLRSAADDAENEARPYPGGIAEASAPFDSLADRIAALLPPREPNG